MSDKDKRLKSLSRKTKINMCKSEISFDKQLKNLDSDIDSYIDDKLKLFNSKQDMLSKYFSIESKDLIIERYKRKLDKL